MKILKNLIFALFLTTAFATAAAFINVENKSFSYLLFAALITSISFGIPNAIFLFAILFLKGMEIFLLRPKYLIIEILILLCAFYFVNKAALLVPAEYRFYHSPTITGIKFYFSPEFIILYSFVALFLILFFLLKIRKKVFNIVN